MIYTPLLYQGDCLERMKGIPDGSVDMVLTDIKVAQDRISAA